MAFLIESDYSTSIRSDLFTLVTATAGVRTLAERQAEQEVRSYLGGRYDSDKIFKPHTVWSPASAYNFNDLVVIQADAYDATATYSINDLMEFTNDMIYIAIDAVAAGETPITDPAKWTLIALSDTFYTALPTVDFVLGTVYTVGQYVVYLAIRYIVTTETTGVQLPTDAAYWSVDATTVAAGTLPTVTVSWTVGDTREPLIIQHIVNIATWTLSAQANPKNIRQDYRDRRDDSIAWLKMAADPRKNVSPDFPERVYAAAEGTDIAYGNSAKNYY